MRASIMIANFHVLDVRGADRFAAATAEAIVQVIIGTLGLLDQARGHALHDGNAPPRSFALVLTQTVGRAMRETQAALDAAVG